MTDAAASHVPTGVNLHPASRFGRNEEIQVVFCPVEQDENAVARVDLGVLASPVDIERQSLHVKPPMEAACSFSKALLLATRSYLEKKPG